MTYYFYSPCTASTEPVLGTVYRPTLFAAYPTAGVQSSTAVGAGARSLVALLTPPAALLADLNYPQVQPADFASPNSFAAYQNAMRSLHDLRLSQITIPVTVGGTTYNLPATVAFQGVLVRLAGEIQAGATTVSLWFGGALHSGIASATFLAALKSYLTQLRAVAGANGTGIVDHVALRSQIEGATTAAHLDAVAVPS